MITLTFYHCGKRSFDMSFSDYRLLRRHWLLRRPIKTQFARTVKSGKTDEIPIEHKPINK